MSDSFQLLTVYLEAQDLFRGAPSGTHAALLCEEQELRLLARLHHFSSQQRVVAELKRLQGSLSIKMDPEYLAHRWAKFFSKDNVVPSMSVIEAIVLQRDSCVCQYCGSKKVIHLHHVIPVARKGKNSRWNVVCACRKCNLTIGTNIHIPTNWWKLHPDSHNLTEKHQTFWEFI